MNSKKSNVSLRLILLCVVIGACVLFVALGAFSAVRFRDSTLARTNSYRITEAMNAYREHYKREPEGAAEEVIDALRGRNPEGVVFLDLRSLMEEQLKDPWGEPYCLLRRDSGSKSVFYSKGPDRMDDRGKPKSDDLGVDQPKQAQQVAAGNRP